MDLGEAKDQAANWLNSRLKNPYFGAVIAVWIITNRVLVFSIFNFDSSTTLADKISYVHQQLEAFDYLSFLGGFKGFYATIVWAIGMGFVTMVFFDIINGVGKAVFKFCNRLHKRLVRLVDPSSFVERVHLEELQKKFNDVEAQLQAKKLESVGLQGNYDTAASRLQQARDEKNSADQKIKELEAEIRTLTTNVIRLTDEKNKFKVTYAKYGTDKLFVEVTNIVSGLLSTTGKVKVDNTALNSDPAKYAVKYLDVVYEIGGEKKSITAIEGDILELSNNNFLYVTETEESKKSAVYKENLKQVCQSFDNHAWRMTINRTTAPVPFVAVVNVDDQGRFFTNGEHKYDLLVTEFDTSQNRFTMSKVDVTNRDNITTETLSITFGGDRISGDRHEQQATANVSYEKL